ncbi:MAG: methyltransferase domain-containing protein [Ilumatobacteraceae bacterium]
MSGGTPSPAASSEEFWNERYRSAPAIWSGNPNPHLVADAADLTPGAALDIGAGEGADAIWLAEHGWRVTAVDISGVALERARAEADRHGPIVAGRIVWVRADLATWLPPAGEFDLVSIQFMHLPSAERGPLFQRCIEAVAPGGTLLIVGHDESDLHTTIRRPALPDLYFHAEAIATELGAGWKILEAGTRGRTARDGEGREVTIRDAVLLARRDGAGFAQPRPR